MLLKAVLDIGTNSLKFILARGCANGKYEVLCDTVEVTRLGEGYHCGGELSERAMHRTASAIARCVKQSRQAGADEILIVGTMAVRSSSNRDEFCALIKEVCGICVTVLSGAEEAALSYLAASGVGRKGHSVASLDIGGGSTEIVCGSGDVPSFSLSLNTGVVASTEGPFSVTPVASAVLNSTRDKMRKSFEEISVVKNADIVGVGGTATTIAAVELELEEYSGDKIEGTVLSRDAIERQITLYASMTLEERKKIIGLPPSRADVILAGACLTVAALDAMSASEITVTTRGIRHALLDKLFS